MKFKPIHLLVPALLLSEHTTGQLSIRPDAIASQGSGAYSVRHTDAFSMIVNQASLAHAAEASANIYGERRFLLSELATYIGLLILPTRSGNFGLEAVYSGSPVYQQTRIGLAYARSLGVKADIGIQLNYNGIRIPGYGSSTIPGMEAGCLLHLTDRLHMGFHISDPVPGKKNRLREKLPLIHRAGFGYDASEKFLFTLEWIKEEGKPINVAAGFRYLILPAVLIKAGIVTVNSISWIGAGMFLRSWRLEVSTGYHPQLGITPGLALSIPVHHSKEE